MNKNDKFHNGGSPELSDEVLEQIAGGSQASEDLSNNGDYVGDEQMHGNNCIGDTGTTERKSRRKHFNF